MSGAPDSYTWPGQYKINGKQVDSGWNPDVTRILWNFYDYKDDKPYDGTITTGGTTSGIILAPKSKVNSASGNHVGTIIADEINHTTGEIHFIIYGTWKDQTVTVTNTKRGEEKEVGKLFIKKELGQGTEMSEDEEFIIKVTGRFSDTDKTEKEFKIKKADIGTAIKVSGVIYGETYKISENELENYTVTIDQPEVKMNDTNQTVTVTNTKKTVGKPESTVGKPESNDIDNDADIDIDNDIVKTGDKNIYDYLCIILIATISILIIKFNDDKKYSDKKN